MRISYNEDVSIFHLYSHTLAQVTLSSEACELVFLCVCVSREATLLLLPLPPLRIVMPSLRL